MSPNDPAVRYLLNSASGAEREKMEERLFAEDGFAELLETAERDLLDAYVRKGLSPELRHQVEAELLTTEEQRDKLLVARALVPRSRRAFSARFVALAASLVILAGISSYWVFHSRAAPSRAPLRAAVPRAVPAPKVAAFLLIPGAVRGPGIKTLSIPAGVTSVRLDLDLPGAATGSFYAVSIIASDGAVVWKGSHLPAQLGALPIKVPASVLPAGQYRVSVAIHPPTVYYFRVELASPSNTKPAQ